MQTLRLQKQEGTVCDSNSRVELFHKFSRTYINKTVKIVKKKRDIMLTWPDLFLLFRYTFALTNE